jgi:sec-independent protein translocase protein TatA
MYLIQLFAPNHIILLVVVLLLFFGAKKIPELMRGLGKGMREFSDAKNNFGREFEEGMKEKDPSATHSPINGKTVSPVPGPTVNA